MSDPTRLRPWIQATWLGWLLGIPCIIGLALLGEAVGNGALQVLVGVGMGLGVGAVQAWRCRALVGAAGPWVVVTTACLALPFLVTDVAREMDHPLPYFLPVLVAIGGLLTGAGQAWLLGRRYRSVLAWVPASVVGWSLAAATSLVTDMRYRDVLPRGVPGLALILVVLGSGGVLLGVATGLPLSRFQRME